MAHSMDYPRQSFTANINDENERPSPIVAQKWFNIFFGSLITRYVAYTLYNLRQLRTHCITLISYITLSEIQCRQLCFMINGNTIKILESAYNIERDEIQRSPHDGIRTLLLRPRDGSWTLLLRPRDGIRSF